MTEILNPSPKTSPDCQDSQDCQNKLSNLYYIYINIYTHKSIYLIAVSLYLSIPCNPLVHSHLGEVYVVISDCFRLRFESLECQNFRAFYALNDHSDFADAQGLQDSKESVERWRGEARFQSEDDKIDPKEKVWACNIKSWMTAPPKRFLHPKTFTVYVALPFGRPFDPLVGASKEVFFCGCSLLLSPDDKQSADFPICLMPGTPIFGQVLHVLNRVASRVCGRSLSLEHFSSHVFGI